MAPEGKEVPTTRLSLYQSSPRGQAPGSPGHQSSSVCCGSQETNTSSHKHITLGITSLSPQCTGGEEAEVRRALDVPEGISQSPCPEGLESRTPGLQTPAPRFRRANPLAPGVNQSQSLQPKQFPPSKRTPSPARGLGSAALVETQLRPPPPPGRDTRFHCQLGHSDAREKGYRPGRRGAEQARCGEWGGVSRGSV